MEVDPGDAHEEVTDAKDAGRALYQSIYDVYIIYIYIFAIKIVPSRPAPVNQCPLIVYKIFPHGPPIHWTCCHAATCEGSSGLSAKMAELTVASEAVTPSSVAPTPCPSPRGDFGRMLECEWEALNYLVC